jgi:Trypsin-like peptidase domain
MLEAAIARVHGAQGRVVGGGFLVERDKVVTCAHVVARALGLADDEPPPAQAEVRLDFPLIAPGELVTAQSEVWQAPQADHTGDVAGLTLAETAPGGAAATRLVPADDLWSHPFRAFGFPAAHALTAASWPPPSAPRRSPSGGWRTAPRSRPSTSAWPPRRCASAPTASCWPQAEGTA